MTRLRASWLLLLAATVPAAADPTGDTLKQAIEPRLAVVLAKTKMTLAAQSYQGLAIDATLSAVLKRFKASKHDCVGAVTHRSCPSKEFHVVLTDGVDPGDPLDAWFVNGKLYRLEKTLLELPRWDAANSGAYAAAFKQVVIAKLGEALVSHPAEAAVSLGYPADVTRPPSGAISLELESGGPVSIHVRWNGASASQLDHLIAKDNLAAAAGGGLGGPCSCDAVTVGSTWPQVNGHGAYRPDDAGRWTVVKVNKKACSATAVDGTGGPRVLEQGAGGGLGGIGGGPQDNRVSKRGERVEWKCSEFHPVYINPAG